jgi:hypothetical protein
MGRGIEERVSKGDLVLYITAPGAPGLEITRVSFQPLLKLGVASGKGIGVSLEPSFLALFFALFPAGGLAAGFLSFSNPAIGNKKPPAE